MSDIRAPIVLAFFAVATLAGCARHLPVAAVVEAPAPVIAPPRPVLAMGYGAVIPPPLGPDGRYRTINSGIGPLQTAWHLRAALNVAAIGCRGTADAALAPSYNAMLASKKAVLADADHFVQTGFRARAATWRADHDVYMTRLYNFFAMPAAKVAFCAAADAIAPQAATVVPNAFVDFAASALPQLEAPFTAVFAMVDRYKVEVAAWDAQYGPDATRLAVAAPIPASASALPITAAPQLAYADLAPVLAWEPHRDQALALR